MEESKLRKFISKAPAGSGIYIFTGPGSKKLYIGKASNIKARLSSYLKTGDQRILRMISLAKGIKILETGSEIEALILESQYIKRHRPAFNIMLRDDKQFFYVVFTKEKFPKIFISHQPLALSNKLLASMGPFTDGTALKTTLRYLRRVFPYCTCKKPHNNFCLNYHIEKCLGICCLKSISYDIKIRQQQIRYRKNIKAIKEILSGKKVSLLKNLEKEMMQLGKSEKFEEAIELRSKIEKIKRVFENARIIRDSGMPTATGRIEGYDVANIQGQYAVGVMVVFVSGKPDKNEYRKFKIYTKNSPDDTAMLKEVLKRRFKHSEWPMPDLIVIDGGKAQLNATHSVISNFEFLISKQVRNPKFQIPKVVALTKDKRHRGSKIYTTEKAGPVSLSKLPADVKNMLLRVDAEAHRFAISYYRTTHRRSLTPPLKTSGS